MVHQTDSWKNNRIKFLIATDVLAKGIDVPTCSHIINFDMPEDFETRKGDQVYYTHKIGRCIRFGRFGMAINLLSGPEDERHYRDIEEGLGYVTTGKQLCERWERLRISELKVAYETKREEHESKGTRDVIEIEGQNATALMAQALTTTSST